MSDIKTNLKKWTIAAATVAFAVISGITIGKFDDSNGYPLISNGGKDTVWYADSAKLALAVEFAAQEFKKADVSSEVKEKCNNAKYRRVGNILTSISGYDESEKPIIDTIETDEANDSVDVQWAGESKWNVVPTKKGDMFYEGRFDYRYAAGFYVGDLVDKKGKAFRAKAKIDVSTGRYWVWIPEGYILDPGYAAVPKPIGMTGRTEKSFWNIRWTGKRSLYGYDYCAIGAQLIEVYPREIDTLLTTYKNTISGVFVIGGQANIDDGQSVEEIKQAVCAALDSIDDLCDEQSMSATFSIAWLGIPMSLNAAYNDTIPLLDAALTSCEDSLFAVHSSKFAYTYIAGHPTCALNADTWHLTAGGYHQLWQAKGEQIAELLNGRKHQRWSIAGQSLGLPWGIDWGLAYVIDSAGRVDGRYSLDDTTGLVCFHEFDRLDSVAGKIIPTVGTDTGTFANASKIAKVGAFNGNGCLYNYNGNDYATFGDISALDDSTFTISVWFKHPNYAGYNIMYKPGDGTHLQQIMFNNNNQLRWYFYNGAGAYSYWTPPLADTCTWHHLAFVKGIGSTNADRLKFYYDGKFQAQQGTSGSVTDASPNTGTFYLNYTSSGFTSYWDNLRIYSTARTPKQIASEYVSERPLFTRDTTSGAVASYDYSAQCDSICFTNATTSSRITYPVVASNEYTLSSILSANATNTIYTVGKNNVGIGADTTVQVIYYRMATINSVKTKMSIFIGL